LPISFTINGLPPSFNEYVNAERRNRFLAAKMKKTETERIQWQCKGITPVKGKVDVTFQAYVKDRKKDPDGIYLYACKVILDSLVELGILENDTQQFIGRIVFEPVLIGEERFEVTVS